MSRLMLKTKSMTDGYNAFLMKWPEKNPYSKNNFSFIEWDNGCKLAKKQIGEVPKFENKMEEKGFFDFFHDVDWHDNPYFALANRFWWEKGWDIGNRIDKMKKQKKVIFNINSILRLFKNV